MVLRSEGRGKVSATLPDCMAMPRTAYWLMRSLSLSLTHAVAESLSPLGVPLGLTWELESP